MAGAVAVTAVGGLSVGGVSSALSPTLSQASPQQQQQSAAGSGAVSAGGLGVGFSGEPPSLLSLPQQQQHRAPSRTLSTSPTSTTPNIVFSGARDSAAVDGATGGSTGAGGVGTMAGGGGAAAAGAGGSGLALATSDGSSGGGVAGGMTAEEEARTVLTTKLTQLLDEKRRIKAQLKEFDMNFFGRSGRLVRVIWGRAGYGWCTVGRFFGGGYPL